jgi:hypothetical protein
LFIYRKDLYNAIGFLHGDKMKISTVGDLLEHLKNVKKETPLLMIVPYGHPTYVERVTLSTSAVILSGRNSSEFNKGKKVGREGLEPPT